MAAPKYYYNPKTLRYERAGISIRNIVSTTTGIIFTGSVFFCGLFFLQNKLITTANERKLKVENQALKEHYSILSSRIASGKVKLATLKQKEEDLSKKFFDVREAANDFHPTPDILTKDKIGFEAELTRLDVQYNHAIGRAEQTNQHYAKWAALDRRDFEVVRNFPGALPVESPDPDLLISGYGTRINPWHKGKFHHDGIDFAGNRGAEVLATGKGTVTLIKKTELTAGFGNYVEIDHGHGYVTRYAHLGEIKVRQGQRIEKGHVIALIGVSGGSIAPHVHYEVLKDGHHIDPMRVLVEGIGSEQFHLLGRAAGNPNQTLH
jgi:murein DD-endopeptidase MepM/ murein hydrolase activator NlpD